ncbi:unnamed protein product [Adineta steineri]|uniref:Uncharacterized protein n=1 Tax=Adineta steineri TaxID=433720 RepID=A0A818GDC5_9BILA|nr:unnamed protein product [Adineta steineri]CAF3489822.1 unnamed protein product [Adineta steineri]
MMNSRYASQIESKLVNINRSLHKLRHHLRIGNNGLIRLEMEHFMNLITEFNRILSNLEMIGRQPEEILTLNNITNYYDGIHLTLYR